jgi:hypothetical protein
MSSSDSKVLFVYALLSRVTFAYLFALDAKDLFVFLVCVCL